MTASRLNSHTKSFSRWKNQTQETFEFSVLVCHAVPTLKRNIRLYEKNVIQELAMPDYYGSGVPLKKEEQDRQKDQLKNNASGYKAKLSKYILISNFSFFESYVIDALNEMIDFHGGKEKFVKNAQKRGTKQIQEDLQHFEDIKRKLRRKNNPAHNHRYRISTQELIEKGYRFPSDLLSSFGAKMLIQKISNIKANDIPNLLSEGLHMEMSDSLIEEFHNVREIRNKIAHGEEVNLTIQQVTNASKTLRTIALATDQHLLKHFFICENFVI
jgi:hypothetical protein